MVAAAAAATVVAVVVMTPAHNASREGSPAMAFALAGSAMMHCETRMDSGGNTLMDSEQIGLFRNGSKRSRCGNAVEHLIIFRIPRRWNSILKRSFSGF